MSSWSANNIDSSNMADDFTEEGRLSRSFAGNQRSTRCGQHDLQQDMIQRLRERINLYMKTWVLVLKPIK